MAERSGTSRTYITRLENDKQDVEMMTLKKIVEAGLNKRLSIAIVWKLQNYLGFLDNKYAELDRIGGYEWNRLNDRQYLSL